MAAQGPATPSALYKMISIPEAQEIVLSETQCLPSISVDLLEAVGHTLAEDVQAPEDVPPFPASIKVHNMCFTCMLAIFVKQLCLAFWHGSFMHKLLYDHRMDMQFWHQMVLVSM